MRELLSGLGVYFWPTIIGAIELIIAILLISSRARINLKRNRVSKPTRGEQIYCSVIGKSSSEMHILMSHTSRRVLFMTDNVSRVTQISREMIEEDIMNLTLNMDKKTEVDFRRAVNEWDRGKSIEFEYFDVMQGCWMSIELQACEGTDYDLIIISNIEDKIENDRLMQEKIAEANLVSQSKTKFLSRMSHEIRTPMNGISGMLKMIHNQPHNDTIEQYLQKADSLSNYMLALINNILDLSRIENDKMELEYRAFDINDLAEDMVNMYAKSIQAKGVRFDVEVSDFEDHMLIGDKLRLNQIMTNLISNASKFTDEGTIKVVFKEMMRDGDNVNFMLNVSDTGKGMDPSFVSRLFKPFEQEYI